MPDHENQAGDIEEIKAWAAGLQTLHARIGGAGGGRTGFLKKGTTSVGVLRQYSGRAGKVDNCQLGVFLAYASGKGRAFIDRELYLPRCWTDNAARCRTARVPEWAGAASAEQLAADVPAEQWMTASAGHGAKGRRPYDWTRVDLAAAAGSTRHVCCWCAAGGAGTGTSPWRCWPTPFWSSPAPRPPATRQQGGRRSLTVGLGLVPLTVPEVCPMSSHAGGDSRLDPLSCYGAGEAVANSSQVPA